MAIVKKYQGRIKTIDNFIDGVYTLELKSMGKPFKYEPGQFLHLALDEYDPAGQWPESRCFSMQSAPNEELIKITYAVKGKFTRRMQQELKIGKQIPLKLPYGDLFTKEHNKTNTIFIAGGTGITPFLSLFNHSSFSQYVNPVLFAGFRNRSMNLYGMELGNAQKINSTFKVVPVYEDEEGILNTENIYRSGSPLSSFFISGPPLMIKIFKQFLLGKGISNNQIFTDDWE